MQSVSHSSASENWIRCSKELPCSECGDTNTWCSVSADGKTIKCRRVSDGAFRTVNDGGGPAYFHHANPAEQTHSASSKNTAKPSAKTTEQDGDDVPVLADVETRHAVYSALLASIPSDWLNVARDDLHRRGLTDDEIQRRGYKFVRGNGKTSAVVECDALVPLVTRFGAEVVRSVPGLYFASDHPQLAANGLFIPVRNAQGQIVAIKVRSSSRKAKSKYFWLTSTKHGGPSPGNLAHVPLGIGDNCETVWVTEGELKADVAHTLAGISIISAPGVTAWRQAIEAAKELGATTVVLAFDADQWTNPNVARAVLECFESCERDGLKVQLAQWPAKAGKGIDDVYANGRQADIEILGDTDANPILAALVGIAETEGLAGSSEATRGNGLPNEAPDDPHRLARLVLEHRFTNEAGETTLVFWRDEWWRWNDSAYETVSDKELRAEICRVIKSDFDQANLVELETPRKEGEPPPFAQKVKASLLTNVWDALMSLCVLPGNVSQPSWLVDESPFPASEVIATKSALVHLPSLVAGQPSTLPPTPQFFSAGCVDYGFDSDADCPSWLAFLKSLWPDDPQSIETLQEWFGYLLLPDTRQHKLLIMIGPPRSGKGTIARASKGVIGERSLASPTLSSLAGPFGLWPLHGKTVALIPEARLGRNTDAIAVVERLLSISGEDPQDIHRKNLPTITGVKLATRFVLMTNELPNLRDSSGAFSNRVVLLRTTQSWLGKEDKQLDERIKRELPGILNWSIQGWQRLQERGHFLQPDSGRELLSELSDLTSPVSQFVRERCVVGPEWATPIDDLFAAWQNWCEEHGRQHAGTQQTFGRDLHARITGLTVSQPRTDIGGRIRVYAGIGLRPGTHWHASHTYAHESQENE